MRTEQVEIELPCTDYHPLRVIAGKQNKTIEQYIAEVLKDHVNKLLLREDIE